MDWLNQLLQPGPAGAPMDPTDLALRLAIAFLFGVVVACTHAFAGWLARRPLDRPFLTTLVLLAVLIALVTIVVGNDVARAFTLAGSLAIVRFRTVVEDTRDTAFVIFAVVAGMAAASNYLIGPLICVPLVLVAVLVLRPGPTQVAPEGTLVLRLAAGRPTDPHIDELLGQIAPGFRLVGVSTARGGAAYDLAYRIPLPPPAQVLALVTELGRIDGVQSVELKER